jgi:hypothetical protein
MKRLIPFPAIFAIALTIAVFLPLYVERTMNHVMFAHPDTHGRSGTVEWGWKRCTFHEFYAIYPHMSREQEPARWLGVNVALTFLYAGVISLSIHWAVRRFE